MGDAIKTRLIKIGNSQGIRIPKTLLEQSGITGEVALEVHDGTLVIRPLKPVRAHWEEAFQAMAANGDDTLLDETTATDWDGQEWEWS